MIAKYNRQSLIVGVTGLIVQIAGGLMRSPDYILLGTILLIVGLAYYAKAKGRSTAWCLTAFLSIIGLLVLGLLEDRSGSTHDVGEGHEQA